MTVALDGATADGNYNYQAPATGANITLRDYIDAHLIIEPAAGIAALTVTMHAKPYDGQYGDVRTTQAITTLTIAANVGQAIANGAPTTLAAGKGFSYIYRAANTTWYIRS